MRKKILPLLALLCLHFPLTLSAANIPVINRDIEPSKISLQHAKQISRACPKNWGSLLCLKSVSESTIDLVNGYGRELKKNGQEEYLSLLQKDCKDAAGASTQKLSLGYMRNAFTKCANVIATLVEQTGVETDYSHYQLLVSPILCIDKNALCNFLEIQMEQYK